MNADTAKECRAYVMVGPTAVGKTAVAHALALLLEVDVLSADSMVVYRGMDIGTAKPTLQQRAQVTYWGIDLAGPDESFSVATYLEEARRAMRTGRDAGRALIVTGGTGLYLRCLMEGLDASARPNPELRAYWDSQLRENGLASLTTALRSRDPLRYDEMSDSDRKNPRRLIRALEVIEAEPGASRNEPAWRDPAEQPLIVGLRMENVALDQRIAVRVCQMYGDGLIEEVEDLQGPADLPAANGIGYAEARGVLDGSLSREDAIQRTIARTRKLARRQMTWFRHQARVCWITIDPDTSISDIANRVRSHWEREGPVTLSIEA
jgi:tRNA dimethylallyltransferase